MQAKFFNRVVPRSANLTRQGLPIKPLASIPYLPPGLMKSIIDQARNTNATKFAFQNAINATTAALNKTAGMNATGAAGMNKTAGMNATGAAGMNKTAGMNATGAAGMNKTAGMNATGAAGMNKTSWNECDWRCWNECDWRCWNECDWRCWNE